MKKKVQHKYTRIFEKPSSTPDGLTFLRFFIDFKVIIFKLNVLNNLSTFYSYFFKTLK